MKQDKEKLEELLSVKLASLRTKKKKEDIINIYVQELEQYINKGKLIQYVMLNLPLCSATISELYQITKIGNMYFLFGINVNDWFTDTEMSQAMENKIKPIPTDRAVFKDVIFNGNELKPEYACYVTYNEWAERYNAGNLTYNINTQRAGKLIKIGGETVIMPTIYMDTVGGIKTSILNSTFSTNTLTLNVTKNGRETANLIYNETNRELTINTDVMECAIIDGMHRTLGCVEAYMENNNIKGSFILQIKNLTVQQAKDFIIQESKANKQNTDDLELFDETNIFTIFIDELNTMGNSETNIFFNNISSANSIPDCLIHDVLLKEALILSKFDNVILQNKIEETENLKRFISKSITALYKIIDNDLNNTKKSFIQDESFVMGLIIALEKIYNQNNNYDFEVINKIAKKIMKIKEEQIDDYIFNLPLKPSDKKEMIKMYSKLV